MKAYRRKLSSRPPLTVGLITKNEEKNIENCLKALLPLKEAIGAQILVGDTGSTDRTIEIAERYADEVFHVEWTNDFAAARNAVMNRGTGEWYLSVDADEWLDDPKELIEFFQSGTYRRFESASVVINNISYSEQSETGEKDNPFSGIRMCRLIPENRFEGKIHETLTCVTPYCALEQTVFTHYGYFYKGEAGRKKEEMRNRRNHELLVTELKENPDSLRINSMALDCCLSSAERIELSENIKHLLERKPSLWTDHKRHPLKISFVGTLIDRMCTAWYQANSFDDILELGKKLQENYPESLFLASVLRKMVLAQLAKQNLKDVPGTFQQYLNAVAYNREHASQNPEKMFGIVSGDTDTDIATLVFEMCDSFLKTNPDDIRYSGTSFEALSCTDIEQAVSHVSLQALSKPLFTRFVSLLLNLSAKGCNVLSVLQQCQDTEADADRCDILDEFWAAHFVNQDEEQQHIILQLQTSRSVCLRLLQMHFQVLLGQAQDTASAFNTLCKQISLENTKNPTFYIHCVALVAFDLNQCLPQEGLFYPHETLHGAASAVIYNCTNAFSSVLSYLESTDSNKTIPQLYWEVFLLYNLLQKNLLQNHVLIDAAADLPTADEISRLFDRFIYLSDMLLQSIYSSDLLNSESDVLCAMPQIFRFCRFMVKASQELERGNFVQSLRLAKKALRQDSRMKHLVKWFSGRSEFSSLTVNAPISKSAPAAKPASPAQSASQNPEFAALAAQFRPKIQALIDSGHEKECLPLLKQYLTFCPDDQEMAALLRKLTQPAPAQPLSQNPEFAALAAQFRPKIEALVNSGHEKECIPLLQQYLTICPDDQQMAALLRKLTQPAPAQPLSQNPEFAALAAQFRPKIQALVDSGHEKECLPLLKQYLAFCPDDEEMQKLLRSLEQA